jgi:hypothetical protein
VIGKYIGYLSFGLVSYLVFQLRGLIPLPRRHDEGLHRALERAFAEFAREMQG